MRKTSTLFLIIFIAIISPKESTSQNINEIMMRATYQISGPDVDGNEIMGSCFIVGKRLKNDSTKSYYVLVTAKHVLEDINGDKAQIKVRIRLADSSYNVNNIIFNIRDKGKNLYYSPKDSSIDVASIYMALPEQIDLELIPADYLADDDYLKSIEIHPGDNVFCVGFPFGRSSNEYFFPILTDGIISSYPILPSKTYKRILLNINIFSGNSGGPIYLYQFGRTINHNTYFDRSFFKIIGLLSKEFVKTKDYEAGKIKFTETTYMKIAEIIPSVYIKELIDSMPDLENDN